MYVRTLGLGAVATAGCLGGAARFGSSPSDDVGSERWPTFQRDVRNSGYAPGVVGLPDEVTLAWKRDVLGAIPVVDEESVYVTDEGTGQNAILGLDRESGETRWRRPTDGGFIGPVSLDDGTVYVLTYALAYALDADDGEIQWKTEVGRGEPAAPIVADGSVYVANGEFTGSPSQVRALSPTDGEPEWTTDLRGDVYGTPAYADGRLFVGTASPGSLYALDAETGDVAWERTLPADVLTATAVADGTVYVADAGGTVRAHATSDGSERWTASTSRPARGDALAVTTDTAYAPGRDGLHALDRADGTERWRFETAERATTPTATDDVVYFGSMYTARNVYAASTADGSRRWTYRTERDTRGDEVVGGIYSPPTVVDGGVFVSAADGVYALE